MANLSEDIQCASSNTRPPMLDRTNFASWQQRIRLYCQGKENGVNILKSIDEGPFQMGTFREMIGMDKSKITRKQSKVSKHGHENQKSAKPKPQKIQSLSQFSSTRTNLAIFESSL
ncbi:hypothetical protein Tco_1363015 [Tanacetum coccineum]